jgi:hypothetical protein
MSSCAAVQLSHARRAWQPVTPQRPHQSFRLRLPHRKHKVMSSRGLGGGPPTKPTSATIAIIATIAAIAIVPSSDPGDRDRRARIVARIHMGQPNWAGDASPFRAVEPSGRRAVGRFGRRAGGPAGQAGGGGLNLHLIHLSTPSALATVSTAHTFR